MVLGIYMSPPDKGFVSVGMLFIVTAAQTLYNEQKKSEAVFVQIPKTAMIILWSFAMLLAILYVVSELR